MELDEKQDQEIRKLAGKFGLRFIVLFGSQVAGRTTDQSDYDLAVFGHEATPLADNLDRYIKILAGLSVIFKQREDKIDLTDLRNEDILLRYQIAIQGQLLAGNLDDYENFRGFIIREYQGAADLLRLEAIIVDRRQKLFAESLA